MRTSGYYWVRRKLWRFDYWQVAEWRDGNHWLFIGDDWKFNDDAELAEINPNPIKPPSQPDHE